MEVVGRGAAGEDGKMTDNEFWLIVRQALLLFVDAIERKLALPRTAELRKASKPQ